MQGPLLRRVYFLHYRYSYQTFRGRVFCPVHLLLHCGSRRPFCTSPALPLDVASGCQCVFLHVLATELCRVLDFLDRCRLLLWYRHGQDQFKLCEESPARDQSCQQPWPVVCLQVFQLFFTQSGKGIRAPSSVAPSDFAYWHLIPYFSISGLHHRRIPRAPRS